jgi:predicted nucleotidyltransferase
VIDLVPRDDSERELWEATLDLAALLDGLPWTLVGAQMVMLHAFEAGQVPGRSTGDLDFLVDVRAFVGATGVAADRLEQAGFAHVAPTPEGIAHRFVKGAIVVDILAPDGLGSATSRETIPGARTIEVAGGSQAIARTATVEVRLGDRVARLRRPSLLGAILLKARAIGAAPDEAEKHRGDLAFLLGLIDDPRTLAQDLRKTERRWLATRTELSDQSNVAWRMTGQPDDAYLAFEILITPPDEDRPSR